jgi:SAM-dependent methyltransferase
MLQGVAWWLKSKLELPEVRGINHDSPDLIAIHRDTIQRKPFLKALYRRHYREFLRCLEGRPEGPVVEVGSGGGFFKEVLPEVITTDLHVERGIDRVMSAERLDFPDASLSGVVMLNVFHHLPDPRAFLSEAARTLRAGGRAVLIEPAHTMLWKRLYRLFSEEPYDEDAREWGFPPKGRFSGANVPQAWIVFERDRDHFAREFPQLALRQTRYHTAFLFLLSGGNWMRAVVPSWSFPVFAGLESALTPAMRLLACQTTYVLERV